MKNRLDKVEEVSSQPMWWNKLSYHDKQEIFLGDQELKQGKGIPHSEVRKQIDKLLGK